MPPSVGVGLESAVRAGVGFARHLSAADAASVPPALVSLGIALGIGLLVGFERERKPNTFAGVRTFGLAGLIGGITALLTPAGATPWPLVIVSVVAGVVCAWGGIASRPIQTANGRNHATQVEGQEIGLTTAFALLATTLMGGYAVIGDRTTTIVAAGVLFLLLYIREPLHALIRRLGQEDVRAIATFVLIALVILPVLPDRAVGPFEAVNPREAWLLVVLVVSMSLAGYVAQSLLGPRAGLAATGLLGGLVSSTATTASAARRAREDARAGIQSDRAVHASAAMMLLACAVLPIRITVLAGIVSTTLLAAVAPWLVGGAIVCGFGGYTSLKRCGGGSAEPLPKPRNPTQLRSALAFAAVFVAIRIASKATLEFGGNEAFLAVAAASGVTDMDAIAMSTAREVADGGVPIGLGAAAVLLALFSNTAFKFGIARVVGGTLLGRMTLPTLALTALCAGVGVAMALIRL